MVLFICHGNVARSQYAEALFRKRWGEEAMSAGTHVPQERAGNTLASDGDTARNAVMRFQEATGIDISGSRRKPVSADLVQQATKIVAITQRSSLPAYVLARSEDLEVWDIDDPHDMDAGGYQQVIDSIAQRIDEMLPSRKPEGHGSRRMQRGDMNHAPECHPEVVSARQGYTRWSETYDTQDNQLIVLEEPLVRSLLGHVRGLNVVDVGCGTGRHTVHLAERGARVTATDLCPEMMAQAIEKTIGQHVQFVTHDLKERFPFESGSFDRILCCLVLEHIPDLDGPIAEMARICRPGGFVLISDLHPAMRLRRLQASFTDMETGLKINVESYRHHVADYVTGALKANLQIERLEEHVANEALLEASPRAKDYWDRYRDDFELGWPMLLLLQLVKPEQPPLTPLRNTATMHA